MDFETMKKASSAYFALLKHKVIDDEHECFSLFQDSEVREGVLMLADQSGTQVLEAHKRIHLVVKPTGSLFATNLTQLKDKYKDIETRKHFHLISTILMVFLAQLDRNQTTKLRFQREGMTYYALEKSVTELVNQWETLLEENQEASKERKLDMHSVITLWTNMELDIESSKGYKRGNKRTRIGSIATALKILEDEKLVVILDKDAVPKIFPKSELYERIEYLYHDYDRYQELKSIMQMEEVENA